MMRFQRYEVAFGLEQILHTILADMLFSARLLNWKTTQIKLGSEFKRYKLLKAELHVLFNSVISQSEKAQKLMKEFLVKRGCSVFCIPNNTYLLRLLSLFPPRSGGIKNGV